MRNKGEKGITLISLTITIIALLIITGVTITTGIKQLGLKKVNMLEADIMSISTKIIDYYLKNESLPIFDNKLYFSNNNELESFLLNKGVTDINSIINPNDSGAYYVIDFSKIEGLTLNYGEKYKNWTNESATYNNLQDIYIINETSLQIYFPQGIKYANEYYFTTTILDERVDAIGLDNIEDGIQIILNSKTYTKTASNEVVTANITINFSNEEEYKTSNIVYAWADSDSEETINNLKYSSFSLDNENKANLSSIPLDKNLIKHFIFIKIIDKNGKQIIKKVEVKRQLYAILYSNNSDNTDLELVFNESGSEDPNRTKILKTNDIIESHYTSKAEVPWNTYNGNIKKVTFDEEIKPKNTAHWFDLCDKLTTIENIKNLDTSIVTSMDYMFGSCSNLTTLNLSNFDTRKVIYMSNMFRECGNLTELNVSSFDTSNVVHMECMFHSCSKLTSLNVTNFNTSNVQYMEYMFNNCNKLTSIDLINFDTSKVTSMRGMFNKCSELTSLNISNFNTSRVNNMDYMFSKCTRLTTIYVGENWDTSNVTSSIEMFKDCTQLRGDISYNENYQDKTYATKTGGYMTYIPSN